MKVRVPVFGTVGKSVLIETNSASLDDLQAQVDALSTSVSALQQTDADLSPFTMRARTEAIIAPWSWVIGGQTQWDISAVRVSQNVPLHLPDGTAAVPSLTFGADTNTGMCRVGADQIGFATNGVLRFVVDANTATSSPIFRGPDGSVSLPTYGFTSDPNTGMYLGAADTLDFSTGGVLRFQYGPAGQLGIGSDYGTVGQVARSTGASAAPTWTSLTAPAAGLTISSGLTFTLANDLSALEALGSTGFAARTATDTWAQRTITGTSARLSVSNGDGVSGNPTLDIDAAYVGQTSITTLGTITTGTWAGTNFTESQVTNLVSDLAGKQPLDATLTALAAFNTNGILAQTAADTFTGRTITGTASRLSVTNGSGVAGNPTLDIDAAYVGQTSITTLGTVTTGTWNGTAIAAAFLADLGANPSATFGANLAGANGSATTYLRSDAVLKLDQAIIPTWTATHTWTDNDKVQLGTGADLQLYHDGTDSAVASLTGALFVSEGALTKPAGLPASTRFAFVTPTANAFAVTGTGNVGFNFVRYVTSLSSPGTLPSGNVMGAFRWNAHDGTAVVLGAQIRAVSTAAWVNTTNSGTRLDLQTTVAGTTGVVNSLQLSGNQALFPDGTAALPSLGLQNSSTAGFYRVGADNLGLALAGTLRYNFTASQFRLATTGGSISAPDLAGDGDTNTGIFWSAADTLQLALGGVAAQELSTNYVDTKVRPRRTAGSSPAALSAGNNNNYSIAANISEVRLTPNAAGSTVTGITNGTNGDQLRLWNISTTVTIILLHDDGATSTAANRFLLASGTNTVLQPGGCADLSYDGTSARWRQINRVA